MANYKIGQILTAKQDHEIERALTGEKVQVPKGSKIIIGADKWGHHFRDLSLQPLGEEDTVNGFDAEGIATWLCGYLSSRYDLQSMLEDYDITRKDFKDSIVEALEEIGFYDEED